MFDLRFLRHDCDFLDFSKKLSRRCCILDLNILRDKEAKRKQLQLEIERLQSIKKLKSKVIGVAKLQGENIQPLCNEVNFLNNRLDKMKLAIKSLQCELKQHVLSLPNIPDDTLPDGDAEKDNLEVFRWGVLKEYDFLAQDHIVLGELIGGLDFVSGVKVTGSRFVVMRGQMACLHRALSQFMLDVHIHKHGYQEYSLPYLVNENSLYGTGQLPKFHKDLFHIKSKSKSGIYTLIPTAEVPLTNLVRDQILEEDCLPVKMVAHTPCFRSEAGTYGHENRGLIRTHQFDKVELVQIVRPEYSMQALEEITMHAEKILQLLQLPYRKLLLSAGNIGFSSCKTYDLDVWFASPCRYYEVSSCSNTGDFQSRRMHARYRRKKDKKIKFLHTLNASGLAVGRTLAAVLEYYQLSDGRIEIPTILQPYMHGLTYIEPLK